MPGGGEPPRAAAQPGAAKQPNEDTIRRLAATGRYEDAQALIAELQTSAPSPAVELLLGDVLLAEGRPGEASACYMAVLADEPDNKHALRSVADLHRRSGNLETAVTVARRLAARGEGEDKEVAAFVASVLVEQANTQCKAAGFAQAAKDLYKEALSIHPENDAASFHLGVMESEAGHVQEAILLYRRAVETNSGNFEAWTNLGVMLRQTGELAEAQAALQQALLHAPSNATVLRNLSGLYAHIGALGGCQARGALQRALAYDPENADALYHLGILDAEAGRLEEALFWYETCVRVSRQHAHAWNNLGVVYQRLENSKKATECYEAAVAARPDFFLSLNNLGVIYTAQGQSALGRRHLRAAIVARPTYAEAHNNLGVLLRDMGSVPEAIVSYEKCMALVPTNANAFQNRLLALNYIHPGESGLVCAAHAEWGLAFEAEVAPLERVRRRSRAAPGRRRLRVAYMSPDLYTHSVSYFAEAPLRGHDSAAIEVFVYCCTPRPDSKSKYLRADAVGAGATWRTIVDMGEEDVAKLIRADEVDVLVELTGHTANNRLGVMRFRPAPVQMTWIGYPNSTGMRSVDYRLTDAVCDPMDTEQTFTEELLRLPGCFLCYTPMRGPPDVASLPCLHEPMVTFGSFNALAKITPEVIQTWCQILSEVPNSRLILKNKPFACAETQATWLKKFTANGIASHRVEALPLTAGTWDHMHQYSFIDISLDPWPYAGTTTTCESLFMGVPCITLAGACHAHNVGVSLLTAVGLPGWIARTRAEYVNLAKHWAAQPESLAVLRRGLRADMLASPLCDAAAFMKGLEAQYFRCYERWADAEGEGGVEAPAQEEEEDGAGSCESASESEPALLPAEQMVSGADEPQAGEESGAGQGRSACGAAGPSAEDTCVSPPNKGV